MHLLHVHSGNLYGGVETMLRTLQSHQDTNPAMHARFALCFEGRLSEELRAAGAPVYPLGPVRVSRPWTVWRARRALARRLAADQPDIVLCHSGWSQAIFGPAARAARIPLVRWLHGAPDPRNWLERWARFARADLAICNSAFTAQALARFDPTLPHAIVHPPVAPPPPEVAADRDWLRASLAVPPGAVVILQVGRIEPGKGHLVLLEALSRLGDRTDWVAWEAGGAQRDSELEYLGALGWSAAKRGVAGRVRFLGERTDIRALLAAADIYCQPNTTPESFGITFVEALYAGLPVVTSGIGGASEIVDPTCGVLVPPGDAGALAEALGRLVAEPDARRRLAAAGPARAVALCGPAQRIAELYRTLSRWSGS